MNFQKIKISFKDFKHKCAEKKKELFWLSLLGTFVLIFFLFCPLLYLNLVMGLIFVIIGIDFYRTKRDHKKARITIFIIFLIGIVYLGMFFMFFMQPSQKLEVTEDGMEYTVEAGLFEGREWWYEPDFENGNGVIEPRGDAQFPLDTAFSHKLSSVGRAQNDEYKVEVKSNIRFIDHKIWLDVYGSDTNDLDDKEQIDHQKINLITSSEVFWRYKSEFVYNVTGDLDYKYYFFVIEGEVHEDQNQAWSDPSNYYFWVKIDADYGNEVDNWDYAEDDDPDLASILIDMLAEDTVAIQVMVVMSSAMIVIFTVLLLLFWVTDQLNKLKYFLDIMLMCGFVLLFVVMIYSEDFPVIKDLLHFIESMPDWFGVWGALAIIVRLIAMLIAFYLWGFTIGKALGLCYGMYYIVLNYIGSFADGVIGDARLESIKEEGGCCN